MVRYFINRRDVTHCFACNSTTDWIVILIDSHIVFNFCDGCMAIRRKRLATPGERRDGLDRRELQFKAVIDVLSPHFKHGEKDWIWHPFFEGIYLYGNIVTQIASCKSPSFLVQVME